MTKSKKQKVSGEYTGFGQLLVLLGLTAFAITEPLLTIFGSNPSLFYFYNIDSIVWLGIYALTVALLPALTLFLVTAAVSLLHRRLGGLLHLIVVGILVGLWVMQLAKWSAGIEQPALVVVFAVASGLVGALTYRKVPAVGGFLQVAAIASVILVGNFLFLSDTASVVAKSRSINPEQAQKKDLPTVLFILLDEFPTMALMDENNLLDKGHFPNLAQLSDQATWYRHFTVTAPKTVYSVPSILTGNLPKSLAPSITNHPNNLFTLLAPTHHLTAYEELTGLCALPKCGEGPPGEPIERPTVELGMLLSKTGNLWLQRITPSSKKGASYDDFQEKITTNLATPRALKTPNFDDFFSPEKQLGTLQEKPARLDKFIRTFTAGQPSVLYYMHLQMPHAPWRFYDSGEVYDIPFSRLPMSYNNSDGGAWLAALSEYRFMQQAQHTDTLLGEVFSRFKALGMWDDAVVVVTADHGRSFKYKTEGRRFSAKTIDGIAYSPLFVKAPGQVDGRIDDSNIMSHDLLPTLANLMGIDIPWPVDGLPAGDVKMADRGDNKTFFAIESRGLFSTIRLGKQQMYDDREHFPRFSNRSIGKSEQGKESLRLLNSRLGLDDYIGQSPEKFSYASGGRAIIDELENLQTPTPDRPALGVIVGNLEFEASGDNVLISVNDQFVTGSPLVEFKEVPNTFIAMLPDGVLRHRNEIRAFLVQEDKLVELNIH